MFRVYYSDGSVYEGNRPEDVKPHDVQCIAWDDKTGNAMGVGRIVMREWDIYIYTDGLGWHGTNKYADLLNHLGKGIGEGGVRAVLQGAWIPNDQYNEIYKRARLDEGLRVKSAPNPLVEDGAE